MKTVADCTHPAPFARVQEEVLGESYMMVPNSKARLRDSVEELAAFLVRQHSARPVLACADLHLVRYPRGGSVVFMCCTGG